jgi:tRNA pseudouridine55 synthase
VDVAMPLRRSTVHQLTLVCYSDGVVTLDLRVSSGTYVRSIAEALGGHCRTLRRTEVGPFSVSEADETRIVPPVEAFAFLPALEVDADAARAIRQGRRRVDGRVRVVCRGELVAVNGTVLP